MNKSKRIEIWIKYDKHCAYCGKEILYEEMQVDHLIPIRAKRNDHINNLMPACRRCNHYKRASKLNVFRKKINTLHERINKNYIIKVALDYGMLEFKEWDKLFYFEKYENH